jgi:hypothetical protein
LIVEPIRHASQSKVMARRAHRSSWRVVDLAVATQAALDIVAREEHVSLALLARRLTVIEGPNVIAGDGAADNDDAQPPRERSSYG